MAKAINKKTKVLLIVLVSMLVVSVCALGGRILYLKLSESEPTVTVPNNQIGKVTSGEEKTPAIATPTDNIQSNNANANVTSNATEGGAAENGGTPSLAAQPVAPLLEFYQGQADWNKKFQVTNMVPGDSETRYYCVRAYHQNPVTLIFETEVTQQTNQLGDVLDVVVSDFQTGDIICQGTFNEINEKKFSNVLAANAEEQTTKYYKIQVSMDTSVGNEYQVSKLLADFRWYIEEGDEGLNPPPQTGDSFNTMLWGVIIGTSLLLFLLLFVTRRKEEEEDDRQ